MTLRDLIRRAALLLLLWMSIGLFIIHVRSQSRGNDESRVSSRVVRPAWRATRALPLNHRLTAADLAAPPVPSALPALTSKTALVGSYLRRAVARGAAVRLSDVSRDPMPVAKEGQIIVTIKPSQEALPDMFPPGTPVVVNGAGATVVAHTAGGVQIAVAASAARELLKKDAGPLLMDKVSPAQKANDRVSGKKGSK